MEIFTDVSGVMTGDPRRVDGARTIPRVNYEEMVELAAQGAKVMHDKAAAYARITRTPYAIKGLRSNVGTTIDEGLQIERLRPVTGITSLHDIASVSVAREAIDGEAERRRAEVALFGRLAADDISIDMVNVNAGGMFFVCDAANIQFVKDELKQLGIVASIRSHCAKLSIVGAGMRGTPGVAYRVVGALAQAGVEIFTRPTATLPSRCWSPRTTLQRPSRRCTIRSGWAALRAHDRPNHWRQGEDRKAVDRDGNGV